MLASEQINTKSPMSFSGFTSRYWRITRARNKVLRVIDFLPRVVILLAAWVLLLVWNLCAWVLFFWATIAWRHYRNNARREKRSVLQHQELLQALSQKTQ